MAGKLLHTYIYISKEKQKRAAAAKAEGEAETAAAAVAEPNPKRLNICTVTCYVVAAVLSAPMQLPALALALTSLLCMLC